MWIDCPSTAWIIRPASIMSTKSAAKRRYTRRRKPEFLQPKEFVGVFSGFWYYLGTYSVDDEPSYLGVDEFIRLPEQVRGYHSLNSGMTSFFTGEESRREPVYRNWLKLVGKRTIEGGIHARGEEGSQVRSASCGVPG